jgi:hypothetical protein
LAGFRLIIMSLAGESRLPGKFLSFAGRMAEGLDWPVWQGNTGETPVLPNMQI